jgi:surfactin synthase thioesterase subunit
MNPKDRWIRRQAPNPRARMRLFCLPFAGGGTSIFRGWNGALPADVEVCLVCPPGREDRLSETPFRDQRPLVAALTEVVRPLLDKPYAIFGYSMGALLGYELARRLRDMGCVKPLHFYPAAHRGPHLPYPAAPIADLPTPALLDELRQHSGAPPGALDSPALVELLLPMLRADFALCEQYKHEPGLPLTCPITVYGGRDDEDVSIDAHRAWREHTTGPFELRIFPGDHFFLQSLREELLTKLAEDLRADLAALSG